MATIQNSIMLNDRMSATFTSVIRAVDHTVTSLRTLNSTGVNLDNSALTRASQQLAIAESEMAKMVGESAQVNNNLGKTGNLAGGLANKLIGAAGMIGAAFSIGKIIEASDQNAQINARLNLITDAPEQLKQQMFAAANEARVPYTDMMDQVAKIGLLAKDVFPDPSEAVQFTTIMDKAFKVSGTGAQESSSAMYQMTQALAAGKLQGDEFRSVMENAPMVMQALSKYLKVSVGELKKMGAEGKITADILKNAVMSAGDEINAKFQTLPMTWGDIWTQMKSYAFMASDGILQKINSIANTQGFKAFVQNVQIAFRGLLFAVNAVVDGAIGAGKFIADNWSFVAPVVWGVVAAITWYALVQAAGAIATGIATAASWLQSAALLWQIIQEYAAIAATKGLAAAQTTLNAAVYAFPGTWLVMAIVAIIVIIIMAIIMLVKWATGTATVAGTIVGIFYWLGAMIYNILAGQMNYVIFWLNLFIKGFFWLYNNGAKVFVWLGVAIQNVLLVIWNYFLFWVNMHIKGFNFIMDAAAAVANGFQTAFFAAINAVAGVVEKFVNGFLKGLNEVGKVVDSVIGTHFSNGAALQINIGTAKGAPIKAVHAQEMGYAALTNPNSIKVDKKEAPQFEYAGFKDPGKAYDNGKKVGDDAAAKVGKMAEDAKGMMDGLGKGADPGKGADTGGGGKDSPAGKTADNTGKMAESMEGAEEDMQYLRDIAEKDYVNKFTTAQINLELNNTNHISKEVDADSFLDKLGEHLTEHVAIAAEGVHE